MNACHAVEATATALNTACLLRICTIVISALTTP